MNESSVTVINSQLQNAFILKTEAGCSVKRVRHAVSRDEFTLKMKRIIVVSLNLTMWINESGYDSRVVNSS